MRSNQEESRLAQAAAGGDGEAFAQLYDRYERPIYNYCLRLLGNEHDAQDATQDAFVKVMRRLPKMGERQLDFGPYLYTTARNASYDMIEKRKRAEPVDEITEGAGLPLGDGPAVDEDPVGAAMLAANLDSIRAANARLPERQREVLALREIQGMSYEDIADLLEMNANSVAQLISRARIRLRAELRGEAAAGVATSGPDCERALPLIASRQDGKLKGGPERDWLSDHMASCPTCPLAAEAMAEAGLSYRAWAPVVPAAWLFRDTVAKAAEAVGADWSGVERPGRADQPDADDGYPGDGTSGGGSAAGGPAGAASGGPAGAAAGTASDAEKKRRRRGLLAGSLGAVALLIVFGGLATGVLGGEPDEPAKPAAATTEAASDRSPKTTADDSTAKATQPADEKPVDQKTKQPQQQSPPEKTPTAPQNLPSPTAAAAPNPADSVASSPPGNRSEPKTERPRGPDRAKPTGAGTGSWGDPVRRDPRPAPAPDPAPPTPTEPPPTTPPASEPEPPSDPPSEEPDPTGPGTPSDPPPCMVRLC